MEVRRWMKTPVHAAKPLDSIAHARELMERHRINQLPVVVDGRLVGIVTDRDLRDAFPSVFDTTARRARPAVTTADPHAVPVEMVMTGEPTAIAVGSSMGDAARLMRQQRIGALPVVDGGRVVGILTRSDVLEAFTVLEEIEAARETGAFIEAPTTARRIVAPKPVRAKAPAGRARPKAAAGRPRAKAATGRARPKAPSRPRAKATGGRARSKTPRRR